MATEKEGLEVVLRWCKVTKQNDNMGLCWLVMRKCLRTHDETKGPLYRYFCTSMKNALTDVERQRQRRYAHQMFNDEVVSRPVPPSEVKALVEELKKCAPKGRWLEVFYGFLNGYKAASAEDARLFFMNCCASNP